MKPLYDYLSDVGEEVDVEITSAYDTHNEVGRAAIEKALYGYGLIGRVEDGEQKGFSEHPKEFPDLGVCQVFKSKAKVRFTPPDAKAVAMRIASELRRYDREFIVSWPGLEESEPSEEVYPRITTTPEEDKKEEEAPGDDDGQELVGQSRVKTIYDEIMKRSKEEEKARFDRLKKIVVTQLGLKDVFEHDGPKGFYTVVLDSDGGSKKIEGPFAEKPTGTVVKSKQQLATIVEQIKSKARG